MKVVLDTNVWVSAWLWRGIPGSLIRLARKQEITICASESLLNELENTALPYLVCQIDRFVGV